MFWLVDVVSPKSLFGENKDRQNKRMTPSGQAEVSLSSIF